MREPQHRLRAAFLAVLFLVGQFGPAGWDLLWSHGRGEAPVRAHIESQSTQACHAERCMLGYVAPTAPVAGPVVPVIRFYAVTTTPGLTAASRNRARPDLTTLHQPRAPPATLV